MTYGTVILASWIAFIVVWGIGAFNVKRDIKSGGLTALWMRSFLLRLVSVVIILFVAARVATGTAHFAAGDALVFHTVLFTPPAVLGWVAAVLTVLGILFAIWARVHLGRNWSAAPAVKEKHELVTSGPYAYVRHPIYTGILLAAFGAALSGSAFAIGIFIIVCFVFSRRIGKEERIMLELFSDTYPQYQARTKRLVPLVW